jgi:hypothetical protein
MVNLGLLSQAHLIMICPCGHDVVIAKGFESNSILQDASAPASSQPQATIRVELGCPAACITQPGLFDTAAALKLLLHMLRSFIEVMLR